MQSNKCNLTKLAKGLGRFISVRGILENAGMTVPTQAEALGVTFGTLGFFLVSTLVLGWKGLLKFDTDDWMSARNTQGAFSLTMSFFASGAGAWVLFTVPEVSSLSAIGELAHPPSRCLSDSRVRVLEPNSQAAILGGPVAILGYAISCVVPLLIFACVAPALRRRLPYGITFFEFVQARYGTVVNGYVTLISMFYMFLYLAAEFTSVGDCVALLSEPSDRSNLPPIIGVSLVTLLYTSVGGLPVSLITDRIQGAGVLIVTVLIVLAILGHLLFPAYDELDAASTALKVAEQSANWKIVTSWGINDDPGNSFRMAIILILAVTSANLMHGGLEWRLESHPHHSPSPSPLPPLFTHHSHPHPLPSPSPSPSPVP